MIPKHLRIHVVLIIACSMIFIISFWNALPDSEKVNKAQPVALAFLQMIDAGQYEQSWLAASHLMQEKISQQEWEEKLREARTRLGPLISREKEGARAQEGPEGEDIIRLTYESRYEHFQDVSEYVTVMRHDDGWKVAGYSREY